MPSLMPGMPGAKEAYGISRVLEGYTVTVPPRALERYGIGDVEPVILTTSHPGEAGFNLWVERRARDTVLAGRIDRLEGGKIVQWIEGRAYARSEVKQGRLRLAPELMGAFRLEAGNRLLVVKSAEVAMSFIPVELWREKLVQRGFHEAAGRLADLEEF